AEEHHPVLDPIPDARHSYGTLTAFAVVRSLGSLWYAHCVRCGPLATLAVVGRLLRRYSYFPTTATVGSEQQAEGRTTRARSARTTASRRRAFTSAPARSCRRLRAPGPCRGRRR